MRKFRQQTGAVYAYCLLCVISMTYQVPDMGVMMLALEGIALLMGGWFLQRAKSRLLPTVALVIAGIGLGAVLRILLGSLNRVQQLRLRYFFNPKEMPFAFIFILVSLCLGYGISSLQVNYCKR